MFCQAVFITLWNFNGQLNKNYEICIFKDLMFDIKYSRKMDKTLTTDPISKV